MEARRVRVRDRLDVESLPPGTIVDFDTFSALIVGDNLLLVFESQSDYVREGSLVGLEARGSNDWIVTLTHDDDGWSYDDVWVKRDWNGKIKMRYVDYDHYYWYDDWDDYEAFEAYEEYDPDDY